MRHRVVFADNAQDVSDAPEFRPIFSSGVWWRYQRAKKTRLVWIPLIQGSGQPGMPGITQSHPLPHQHGGKREESITPRRDHHISEYGGSNFLAPLAP